MLPYGVLELRYYLAGDGESPFEEWFSGLDAAAGAKVSVALARWGRAISRTPKAWARGCLNTGSIGGLDIGCISGATAKCW